MKRFLFTLTLTTLILTLSAAALSDDDVNQRIRNEFSYPDFARRDYEEGYVNVTFTLDSLGYVAVKMADTDNPALRDYVVDKMEKIFFDCQGHECKDYTIRIEFRLR
jgi:hypothetical protein